MEIKLVCPICLCGEFETPSSNNGAAICCHCKTTHDIKNLILFGNFYVYQFVNDDWGGVPFYVGKGSGERYKTINTRRSKHIQSICNKWKWHSEIIKYCETELQAFELEKELKESYIQEGYPLIDGELEQHAFAQRRGLERAKLMGVSFGRPKVQKPSNWDTVIEQWRNGQITAKKAMDMTGTKRTTFYKFANGGEW